MNAVGSLAGAMASSVCQPAGPPLDLAVEALSGGYPMRRRGVARVWLRPSRRDATVKKQGRYVILRLMTTKLLQDAMRRVEAWPEAAQVKLAELALEIDAGFSGEDYRANSRGTRRD